MGKITWHGPFSPAALVVGGITRYLKSGDSIELPDAVCEGARNVDGPWWTVALTGGLYPSPTRFPATNIYPN